MAKSFAPRRRWLDAIALILCIGMIWGLSMPAVVVNREAARRAQCTNNVKNLALATVNFEITQKQYPGYQALFGNRDDGSAKTGSWAVALLPLLEQSELRDTWDDPTTHESWQAAVRDKDEQKLQAFYPAVQVFICAEDLSQKAKFGALSYGVNAGLHLLPNDPALGLSQYANAGDASEHSSISQRSENGVFANRAGPNVVDPHTGLSTQVFGYHADRIQSQNLRDGLSQTFLFSENCSSLSWLDYSIVDDSSRSKLGIVWLYAGDSASEGRPKPTAVTADMRINNGKNKSKLGPFRARPSGFHAGGIVVAAFADGSTSSISSEIDYHIYQSLMAPHDSASDIPNRAYVLKDEDYQL
ncbi:MAG: DUF1559 domain-containing protein [Pirellulaceae bacterium]|nr:DUF1559 domain-containing protein [Pirellulaceae bacterium]